MANINNNDDALDMPAESIGDAADDLNENVMSIKDMKMEKSSKINQNVLLN